MENNTIKTIKDLKNEIKTMADYQKVLKAHRKSEKFVGERTTYTSCGKTYELGPSIATMWHQERRHKLRMMNVAYGILRGRTLMQIENTSKEVKELTEQNHPLNNYWLKREYEAIVKEYSGNEEVVCSN